MKHGLALFLLFPAGVFAQTTWLVDMGGSTSGGALPYYAPQHLTINVNDMVRWRNQSGTHSVNGSLILYPSNPEGFSSGEPQNGQWNFEHTFTIPGVYNFHCTADGHAATQNGSVTVLDPTGMARVEEARDVTVHPVPTNGLLHIGTAGVLAPIVTVVDLDGATVLRASVNATGRSVIDVSSLTAGNYFLLLTDADGRVIAKPFTKD